MVPELVNIGPAPQHCPAFTSYLVLTSCCWLLVFIGGAGQCHRCFLSTGNFRRLLWLRVSIGGAGQCHRCVLQDVMSPLVSMDGARFLIHLSPVPGTGAAHHYLLELNAAELLTEHTQCIISLTLPYFCATPKGGPGGGGGW